MKKEWEDGVDVNAKGLVTEVYHIAKRVIGKAAPSKLSISKDQYGTLVSCATRSLKNIVLSNRKFTEDLRGLNGYYIYSETLPDIWESLKNSIDVELAKVAFGQAVRYATAELASDNVDCGDMVNQLAASWVSNHELCGPAAVGWGTG
jgi:hypothetical protein